MQRWIPLISPLTETSIERYLEQGILGSILLINSDGVILQGNKICYNYLGYGAEEIIGEQLNNIIQTASLTHLIEKFKGTTKDKSLPIIRVKMRNGTLTKSSYTLFKVKDGWEMGESEKEGEDYYVLMLHDCHPKPDHLELHQRFPGTFMKDVNLGVIIVNMDFRLKDISDMACKILGVERDVVLNKTMEEVFANVPIEHQLVQRTILDGQVVRNHAISWTNNQERYELLMDSNLLKTDVGETVGAYIIFKDVSNLRSLEEQVLRSDRLAMIGQISAGTAHEIRNPLTSIKGFLQILNKRMKELEMEKEHRYTEIMLDEIDRINNLVSEFLLLSKPKNVSLSKVNLSTVIKDILPIINNEALLHNVTVQYETKYGLPNVVADRELLKQVCLNISKNGIEAIGEGGGILTLLEDIDLEERRVCIEIHDTGPGIPSFLIDKIFDPFFTTKEKGTGLGLSVCQRIVHDMGGIIRVSSKGYGTTFTISVPYSED